MLRGRPAARPLTRRRGVLIAACLAAALAPDAGAGESTALGPAPRDGEERFENLAGPIERAGFGVVFPFQWRRMWTNMVGRSGAAQSIANDGAFLRDNAQHSIPTVTWIGHATLLVQIDGATFLTDPIWSERASPLTWIGPKRLVAPGVDFDALPPIDFVIVSHNHYDHLDLPTLRRLADRDPGTLFLVPLGNGTLLREAGISNVEELDWGARRRVGELAVVCVPAQHWSARGLGDDRRALWSSWVVMGSARRFYFSGDTGYFAGFRSIGDAFGPFDVAALAIGAYMPEVMMRPHHLDPEEAVEAWSDLRAQRAVGIHFGTFDLADEPLDEPPRRFQEAARAAGRAEGDTWILRVGETRGF